MTGIDIKRLRERYEENQRGGDLWKIPEGVTLVYVHGLCRPDDEHELTSGKNFLELSQHYGLGVPSERKSSVCLDRENNPIIAHPVVMEYLERREVSIGDYCPPCRSLAIGDLPFDTRASKRFVFGFTPRFYKINEATEEWQPLPVKPMISIIGSKLYEDIMKIYFDNDDISDMDAAVYVKISRTGNSFRDTRYAAGVYTKKNFEGSLMNPAKFNDRTKKILQKAVRPDGDCDLFRIVSNLIRPFEDVEDLVADSIIQTVDVDE
jgi:hypothetical protein